MSLKHPHCYVLPNPNVGYMGEWTLPSSLVLLNALSNDLPFRVSHVLPCICIKAQDEMEGKRGQEDVSRLVFGQLAHFLLFEPLREPLSILEFCCIRVLSCSVISDSLRLHGQGFAVRAP